MPAVSEILDLSRTIASALFQGKLHPWQILPDVKAFIPALGRTLPAEFFHHPAEDVWIARDAKVALSAYIDGPCIIDRGAEVRHSAFIRGGVVVGKDCVVGNSTELKNSVLFDGVQAPHYNYVGDSVLGHRAHMGAGSITSNVKSDRSVVFVKDGAASVDTGLFKFGAVLGDFVEVGCNSVLNPGTVIGRGTNIYPLSSVRGVIPANSIYKNQNEIVLKKASPPFP